MTHPLIDGNVRDVACGADANLRLATKCLGCEPCSYRITNVAANRTLQFSRLRPFDWVGSPANDLPRRTQTREKPVIERLRNRSDQPRVNRPLALYSEPSLIAVVTNHVGQFKD